MNVVRNRSVPARVALTAAAGYALVELSTSLLWVLWPSVVGWQLTVTTKVLLLLLGTVVALAAARPIGAVRSMPRPSWLLVAVLAVFPLSASVRAGGALAGSSVGGRPLGPQVADLVPGRPGWTVLLLVASSVGAIGAALGLVSVLLRMSGQRGLGGLGLDRSRPAYDSLWALAALSLIVFPLLVGTTILDAVGLTGYAPTPSQRPVYRLAEIVDSVQAGLVEEVCVLGFLVWCGRRARWPTWVIVAVAVLVRVSFHVYYGWGVLPFVFWALGTVLVFLYMPTPRVTPFVIAHISWDLALSLPPLLMALPVLAVIVMFVVALRHEAVAFPDRAVWALFAAEEGGLTRIHRARPS